MASTARILDHFHVLGCSEYSTIPPDTVEVGLDLHNEPVSNCDVVVFWGCPDKIFLKSWGRLPSSSEFINRLLELFLDIEPTRLHLLLAIARSRPCQQHA